MLEMLIFFYLLACFFEEQEILKKKSSINRYVGVFEWKSIIFRFMNPATTGDVLIRVL